MKFELDSKQMQLLKKWQHKIEKKYKDISISGGTYQYRFTPTGIGDVVIVKHKQSGKKINLTNVDNW